MVRGFLVVELEFEFGLVFLGYSSKLDDDMQFTRRIHGRLTRAKMMKEGAASWHIGNEVCQRV